MRMRIYRMRILKSLHFSKSTICFAYFFVLNNEIHPSMFPHLRFGSRIDALNGRRERRPQTFSELRAPCCPLTACLSSLLQRLQQQRWATASALSMPTIPAGPLPECPACLSCNFLPLWAGNRPWPNPCRSAAWELVRRPTPWAFPTCRPTAQGSSHTCISPHSRVWCRLPSPGLQMWPARPSFVAHQTVTSGEGQASPRCAAKRWSTQSPWVSPNENDWCYHFFLVISITYWEDNSGCEFFHVKMREKETGCAQHSSK